MGFWGGSHAEQRSSRGRGDLEPEGVFDDRGFVAEEGVLAGLEEVGAAFGEGETFWADFADFSGAIDRAVDVEVGVGIGIEEGDLTIGFDDRGHDERSDARYVFERLIPFCHEVSEGVFASGKEFGSGADDVVSFDRASDTRGAEVGFRIDDFSDDELREVSVGVVRVSKVIVGFIKEEFTGFCTGVGSVFFFEGGKSTGDGFCVIEGFTF